MSSMVARNVITLAAGTSKFHFESASTCELVTFASKVLPANRPIVAAFRIVTGCAALRYGDGTMSDEKWEARLGEREWLCGVSVPIDSRDQPLPFGWKLVTQTDHA